MKKQTGVSLSGLIVVLALVIVVALVGFKVFTPYMQYFMVQKAFKAIAADPELKSGNTREIKSAFDRYRTIDYIEAVSSDDIEVTKDGSSFTVSVNYSVKVPLIANISLVIYFAPAATSR